MSSKSSKKSPSKSRSALASASRTAFVRIRALLLAAALVAIVAPARATPVDVFFDGNRPASDPDTAYGISLAAATNAHDNFGVPIIDRFDVLTGTTGKLSVIQPPSSSLVVTPFPPTSSLNRVTSNWEIENVSGSAMTGASYLLFTHTGPFTYGTTPIDYADGNVGLRIDADLGWAIIKTTYLNVDYYYPALLLDRTKTDPLDGLLAPGARVSGAINYVVTQPLVLSGSTYVLPQLHLGFAQTLVPEPGTALLLGLGLTLLSARRKRA